MAEENTATNNNENAKENKAENIDEVKVMSALAYLGILFFLPLVTHPESKFGKFHANQGLLLLIFGVGGSIISGAIPILGWFILAPIVSITTIVFFIIGLVNALNKEMKRLPLIGNYDLIK